VIIGILVEVLLNDIPVVGIGVLLFPILKKYSQGIALWYVGMRVIEGVTLIVGSISALSLITLSQEYSSWSCGFLLFSSYRRFGSGSAFLGW
jgi:hypothetical protein